MTVGIVGLGLIGGSFAKAYQEAGATVLAWNRSRSVLDFAIMSGAVDAELTEDNIAACDLVLIALYPEATIEWFRRMAPHIGAHPVVLDCGGTKRTICAACFPIAKEHGVTFLGGHPMAGTQYSGFKNAKATMYHARRWSSCRRTLTMCCSSTTSSSCSSPRALRAFPSRRRRRTTR